MCTRARACVRAWEGRWEQRGWCVQENKKLQPAVVDNCDLLLALTVDAKTPDRMGPSV